MVAYTSRFQTEQPRFGRLEVDFEYSIGLRRTALAQDHRGLSLALGQDEIPVLNFA